MTVLIAALLLAADPYVAPTLDDINPGVPRPLHVDAGTVMPTATETNPTPRPTNVARGVYLSAETSRVIAAQLDQCVTLPLQFQYQLDYLKDQRDSLRWKIAMAIVGSAALSAATVWAVGRLRP